MSIWGKIGGAAAGFVLGGGPLGALVGALAGHFAFDRPADEDVVFSLAMIALSAKMAKADGVVTDAEFKAFKHVVKVPPEDERSVKRMFDFARRDIAGYEAYASQIAGLFRSRPGVLEDLLDGLFFIAAADDTLHDAEIAFLKRVAEIFGLSESAFNRLCAAYGGPCAPDPYALLNADPKDSDADLRKAYLFAVRENHPDTLRGRGVPEEFLAIANEKLARINVAWELICKERGLK